MSTIDLENLSVSELTQLKGNIDNAITQRHQQEVIEVREKIEALLDKHGFTLDEVMSAKKARTVKPKYRNPNNAAETWTGRGRRPSWAEQIVSSGGDLNDYLIEQED